jgi:CheY-like chemotaxis protein
VEEPVNPARPPLVAVFNNDPDLINMLATWFETHGIRAVCGRLRDFRRGHEDVAAFVVRHQPTVLLFDVSVPYASNWDYLAALRLIPETSGLPFVITTANKQALEKAVGLTTAIEITGTAADFEIVTNAVLATQSA